VVQAVRAPPPEVVSWINEEPKRIEQGSGLGADELRRPPRDRRDAAAERPATGVG
jgi:hypothetical protein